MYLCTKRAVVCVCYFDILHARKSSARYFDLRKASKFDMCLRLICRGLLSGFFDSITGVCASFICYFACIKKAFS